MFIEARLFFSILSEESPGCVFADHPAVPGHIPWVASHKHTYITLQNNLRLSSGNHPWPELTPSCA